MHGGVEQSGGQPDNRNALKHGRYTAEAIAQRREVAALLRACRDQLGGMSTKSRSPSDRHHQCLPAAQRW
jgi:hypothetical protein